MTMCNKEQLVGYLYDELDAGERQTVEAHLALCEECRVEVAGLQQTRQHLTTWSPPQPEFTFHIVRGAAPASAPVAPALKRFGFVPQWAMAAAASLLVLAGAAAIAHVELRYGPEGFVVRTGWASERAGTPPAATPGPVQAASAGVSSEQSEQLKAALRVLESRLAELEQARASQTVMAARTTPAAITAPELRKVMAASEARQREEMALQVSQVWKDFSAARVNDFTRLQDIVGRAQGVTNQQLRQHRDSIELLSRVSASQR
jgi:anti-sigma factor RsiW